MERKLVEIIKTWWYDQKNDENIFAIISKLQFYTNSYSKINSTVFLCIKQLQQVHPSTEDKIIIFSRHIHMRATPCRTRPSQLNMKPVADIQ